MTTFDYIIVGAGSSGCVLANRLSENPQHRVLLIEAGGDANHLFIRMPRGAIKIWSNPRYFWYFPVKPQLGREAERQNYGKVLGGSSSINGTWYLRGMPRDYDSWEEMGNTGWGWDNIERAAKKVEDYRVQGAHASRGKTGPVQITRSPYRSPSLKAAIEAAKSIGIPYVEDINEPNTEGVGYTQSTVDRIGRRASSYTAYVEPVEEKRPNLTVVTRTQVKRVLFDGDRATGVICDQDGVEITYSAKREIILSAGVYKSPQILQLSGIGAADLLHKHGIPVVSDNPQVGQNIRDHAMLSVSYRLKNEKGLNHVFSSWRVNFHGLRYILGLKGLMSYTGMPLTMLISGKSPRDWPDLQIGVGPFSMRSSKERKADPGRGMLEDKPGFTFNGFHLRPNSKGAVRIVSGDYKTAPEVEANWWSDPEDRNMAVLLVRKIRELARTPALSGFCAEEVTPGGQFVTDEEIANELKWLISPGLHATGSCTMGPDATTAVVDPRCRVHGVKGLRVVDCSIMPTPVSGNTNGPAMIIAEHAAELILEDAKGGAQ